jgi:hypothetical protein
LSSGETGFRREREKKKHTNLLTIPVLVAMRLDRPFCRNLTQKKSM